MKLREERKYLSVSELSDAEEDDDEEEEEEDRRRLFLFFSFLRSLEDLSFSLSSLSLCRFLSLSFSETELKSLICVQGGLLVKNLKTLGFILHIFVMAIFSTAPIY